MRPGRAGEPFTLVKFRTVTDDRSPDGALLADEQGSPGLGVAAGHHPNELPEMWRALRWRHEPGRPTAPAAEVRRALRPTPRPSDGAASGITGLAQVSGRNELSWEERLELDVRYVETALLWLDLRILARSLVTVLRRQGISAEGHATGPKFSGSGDPED